MCALTDSLLCLLTLEHLPWNSNTGPETCGLDLSKTVKPLPLCASPGKLGFFIPFYFIFLRALSKRLLTL